MSLKDDFLSQIGKYIEDQAYASDLAYAVADQDAFAAFTAGEITEDQIDSYKDRHTRLYQKYVAEYHSAGTVTN